MNRNSTLFKTDTALRSLSLKGRDLAQSLGQANLKARHWLRLKVAFRLLAREPLVHFLLAGALIFGINILFKKADASSQQARVEVSAAEVERLRALWGAQWKRPPTPKELKSVVDDFVREEVLYREALAIGLERDDSVIRRRLVQKMEFLSQDPRLVGEPTPAELAAYFEKHKDRYRDPPKVAFSHIFFSRSLRGASATDDARRVLVVLHSGRTPSGHTSEMGDPFMLQHDFPAESQQEISAQFGPEFASAILSRPRGSWQGPIESAFGLHLVRISERRESRLPAFDEVRSRVFSDLMNERLRDANEKTYARIRSRYQVVIRQPGLEY